MQNVYLWIILPVKVSWWNSYIFYCISFVFVRKARSTARLGFRRIWRILQISDETSLHCLGVSEIRKHLCTVWGYPKFGNIFALFGGIRNSIGNIFAIFGGVRNSETFFFSLLGCFQISGETFDLSSAIFCFRVIREFLLLVFILNLRFRENKENSTSCKGGVLEIRAKFTFNFLPKFNFFRKKNMILPCLNQLVGQRLPISSQKYTIFLAFLSVCSEFSKNVMPQISLERVRSCKLKKRK